MEAMVRTTSHCAGSKPREYCCCFYYLALQHLSDNGERERVVSVSLASGIIIHDNTLLSSSVLDSFRLEKEMATHSSILAWGIPGTEEPSGLPSKGSHRVGYDWSDLAAAAAVYSDLLFYNNLSLLKAIQTCFLNWQIYHLSSYI